MNDDQLIQRLVPLKRFQAKDETIHALKSRVFSGVEDIDRLETHKARLGLPQYAARFISRPAFLYPAAGLLFIVLVATQGKGWLATFHRAYIETRIAMGANAYEKARFSLDRAQFELKSLENGSTTGRREIAYLSSAMSETDHYMNGLHLMGEAGQYSSQQCQGAYQAYEDYLEELQAVVENTGMHSKDPAIRADLLSLRDEADRYQQVANAKLKRY